MSIGLIILISIIIVLLIIFIVLIIVFSINKSNNGSRNNDEKEIQREIINKNSDFFCIAQRDCAPGYVCSKGICKKGLGEVCIANDKNESGDCHNSYVCDGICRKRKPNERKNNIRKIRINNGNVQNESLSSSDNSKIKSERYYEKYRQNDQPSKKDRAVEQDRDKEYPIDVCNYSIYTIYLMNNGNIILDEDGKTKKITTDIHMTNLCNFNGYVYAISDEKFLYHLDNDTLDHIFWRWKKVDSINNIIEMSATHDKQNLWIRNKEVGILYDKDFKEIEKVSSPSKRVYGVDKTNYLVIDKKGITSYPNMKYHGKSEGVVDLLIDHKGMIHLLSKKKYRMIKLINYEVCYIA